MPTGQAKRRAEEHQDQCERASCADAGGVPGEPVGPREPDDQRPRGALGRAADRGVACGEFAGDAGFVGLDPANIDVHGMACLRIDCGWGRRLSGGRRVDRTERPRRRCGRGGGREREREGERGGDVGVVAGHG